LITEDLVPDVRHAQAQLVGRGLRLPEELERHRLLAPFPRPAVFVGVTGGVLSS
jgi:hypothetical protein